ncbi:MAG: PIN domain-containing protein [Thaumarchaeota archaeon]|nr:MAG: PIN domain-containing protein [Nitrososphaerota archaeon]
MDCAPLTPDVAIPSAYLRNSTGLSFFDAHCAATALSLDRRIVSFDRAYDRVPGLSREPTPPPSNTCDVCG